MNNRPLITLKHRRIWGAAHRAGYLAGSKNNEGTMSAAQRLRNIEANLHSQTQKVLYAMPVGEEVTMQQVLRALSEGGKSIAMAALQRSLLDLVDVGLIRKMPDDKFIRRAIEEPTVKAAAIVADDDKSRLVKVSLAPLDRLATLAHSLRQIAGQIDDAILEVEQQIQDAKMETRKLSQLKELLKDL